MKTVKLFWNDQYLREFTASIVKKLIVGNKPAVILNQTAFYATSGGQPNDTGFINGVKVVDVVEQTKEETIVHVLAEDLKLEEGAEVKGVIDWERRVDHMQQHHGQHILSKAFIDVANAATLSFHMGADLSYIDLDNRDLSEEIHQKAQSLANHVIFSNKAVSTSFHSLAEAKKLPLRKLDDAVVEPVRIIKVSDADGTIYDMQACCGTHPNFTGQVQAITIVNYEKIKKTQRLYFVCGMRTTNLLYKQAQSLKRMGLKLTSPPDHASVEKAFDQTMIDVTGLKKTVADNEKVIVKAVCNELIEQNSQEIVFGGEKNQALCLHIRRQRSDLY
eukprot:TRINITY_DN6574_c0_g1_i1.p1 TRINITY_DN6574_c0_g1~~TRINITY_DN6574_c0_g1_i1.p1  ORF type:complete len:332 (-),score=61.93 TRINITY_DN6574_c0_g1_i1:216-1211(-)